MVCYAEPVIGNHVVLCWAIGWKSRCEWCASECESWWAMHSQWLWIMMRYAEPVVCESWCAILYQCSWIMDSYAQLVVVIHGELFWASGWESCCAMLSQWLWIMASHAVPVVVNHVVQCLANGCESWRIMLHQ